MAVGTGGVKMGSRALTSELRKLASQPVDVEPDGTPITREAKLAALIWRQALGWTERVRDVEGNLVEKTYPPVAWAQQYLYERLEGKVAQAVPDEHVGIKAVDRVRDLSRDRLNLLAKIAQGPPKAAARNPGGQRGSGGVESGGGAGA
jgi:hypothetical protein